MFFGKWYFNKMTKKQIILAAMAGLTVSGILYSILGGFSEPEISRADLPEEFLIVLQKSAPVGDESLRQITDSAFHSVKTGRLKGEFTIVWDGNPDAENDSTEVQISAGVLAEKAGDTLNLPAGFVVLRLPAGPCVRAEITAHPLVTPNPAKVNSLLRNFAEKAGLKTGSRIIERYPEEGRLRTEIPILR